MFSCVGVRTLEFPMNSTTVCPINIGPKQRRMRLIAGVVTLVVAVVIGGLMAALGQPWFVRLAVGIPLWFAVLNAFQVATKTCVHLAAKGQVNLDQGAEEVQDQLVAQELRRRARGIYLKTTLVSLVLTLIFAFLPV
jgi:hypothetical protein